MSASAMAYVLHYSPYRGSTFLVHVMVGDTANDAHQDELWMSQEWLAKKCRVSTRTVWEAMQTLTKDGWLTLLEDNSRRGKPNRYRFEYPQATETWGPGVRNDCVPGPQSAPKGSATIADKLNKNSNEPLGKGPQSLRTPVDKPATPVGPFLQGSGAIGRNRDCSVCDGMGVYLPDGSDEAVECDCKRGAA